MKKLAQKFFSIIQLHYKKVMFILMFFLLILLIPWGYIMFSSFSNITRKTEISEISKFEAPEISGKKVAIVFGAAARGNAPSDIFADRLRVASDLYHQKKIQKILVSGDNKTEDYNEPQAGKNFLLTQGVDTSDIILDHAGFSTHDTCARAKKVFGVDNAYLVTQEFHLPRAVFLCEYFGIQSHGVSASIRDYRGTLKNLIRESLAHQKAFYELFFFPHEPKFLGKEEFIFEKNVR